MTSTKPKMQKSARTFLWLILDAILVNAAMVLAQLLRYSSNISYDYFDILIFICVWPRR